MSFMTSEHHRTDIAQKSLKVTVVSNDNANVGRVNSLSH